MLARIIYLSCGITSMLCFVLLMRSYLRTKGKLLFYTSLFFAFMTISNVLLFIDLIVAPQRDLSMIRTVASLIGVSTLLYGLIWKEER
jgi:nicotinamide riboside transporter PnuC